MWSYGCKIKILKLRYEKKNFTGQNIFTRISVEVTVSLRPINCTLAWMGFSAFSCKEATLLNVVLEVIYYVYASLIGFIYLGVFASSCFEHYLKSNFRMEPFLAPIQRKVSLPFFFVASKSALLFPLYPQQLLTFGLVENFGVKWHLASIHKFSMDNFFSIEKQVHNLLQNWFLLLSQINPFWTF